MQTLKKDYFYVTTQSADEMKITTLTLYIVHCDTYSPYKI